MRFALVALVACSSSSSPASPAKYAGIAQALARGDAPKTTSVLVMRGGNIEYEQYFNGATAATLHDTRSAMKSVTSLAIGAAIDRKVLPGVTAPAFAYLADLKPFAHDGPLEQAITLEDLLTMSSALDCDDNDNASPGNEENMYPKKVWARWAADLGVRADYQRDATGRGPWHYCTAGTFLLGQILQRAAKQPVDKVIAETLFAPMGITEWEFPHSDAGEVMTGGGLRLKTRDLAALGWMIRSGGSYNGKQILSPAYIRAALTRHRVTPFSPGYGYLFWENSYQAPCGTFTGWAMSGNGGNAVIVFAELDAVVVVTRTNYATKGMHQQTAKLVGEQILPDLACHR
jgi:CubicO group peptidase (beta-lactamase class C family)